jgi:hypothetical protein
MEHETIDAADLDNIMNGRPVIKTMDMPPPAATGPATPAPAP